MNKISFNTIKELFPTDMWDVSYLSAGRLLQAALSPIKHKWNYVGEDLTNNTIFHNITNAVVLIKKSHTWDYTLYTEAEEILRASGITGWHPVYTNYKEAAIFAGLGVRARNSLVYTYKFGFDCHITVMRFEQEIIDIPTNKRVNSKMWRRCKGCDDCAKACPVGAINNKEEPYWLNSTKCETFIAGGEHPVIPSVHKFIIQKVFAGKPPVFTQPVIHDKPETYINGNGYTYDGTVVRKEGRAVHVPFCRECTAQPRCSKWDGKYPYKQMEQEL